MKWFTNLFWSRWKVARTIWPYADGYGTYRRNSLTGERIILDTGLSKQDAKDAAAELNKTK